MGTVCVRVHHMLDVRTSTSGNRRGGSFFFAGARVAFRSLVLGDAGDLEVVVDQAFERVAELARANGIARSMGQVGSAYDNAVAETFFATLKKELIHRRSWPTKQELRSEVFEFIESFYNRQRRHSYLGWISPAEFEHRASPVLTETTQS